VETLWHLVRHRLGNPAQFIGLLAEVYKASTALTYARTYQALHPEVRTTSWSDAMLWLEKRAAVEEVNQANPVKPEQMRKLLALPGTPHMVKATAALMWVTASRHADLGHMKMRRTWPSLDPRLTIADIALPLWKSDVRGKRHCHKVVTLPKQLLEAVTQPASYTAVYRALKTVEMTLTPHGIRRGAVTYLTEQGIPPEEIIVLTQHAPGGKENVAIRLYCDPTHIGKEVELQRRLAMILLRAIM